MQGYLWDVARPIELIEKFRTLTSTREATARAPNLRNYKDKPEHTLDSL
jgi:hypothetical protein